MMKATTLMTALICSLGLFAGTAMAQPGPGKAGARMFAGLELTESQKEQLKALHETHKAEAESNREAHKAAMQARKEQAKALLTDPSFDADAAKALINSGDAQREAAALRKLQHKHAVLQILTPEQQEKFLAREAKMKKAGMKGKGKKGDRSCPQGKRGKKGPKGEKAQS